MSGVTIDGLDALLLRLDKLGVDVRLHAAGAVYELAQEVMDESNPLTPKDLGILRLSAHVDKPVWEGKQDVSVTMGYGGEAKEYAEVVHENLGNVNWTTPGSGPKYLERPFLKMRAHYRQKIAARIATRVGIK